ncbi:30S ribosome-binding factor RbfA [Amorphus coralli]|uniref:30S ribosome-binding factor RbfA n=1 Tax=Amorphus coralli TaxID=340680 RepID=UPI00035EEF24
MTLSQRQLRVGELVRHALSDVFMRGDVHGLGVPSHLVTIPEVRMTPDLKVATVLVMPLGDTLDRNRTVKALEAGRKQIRGTLAKRVELKFVPDLRFVIDTRFDDDDRINDLLEDPDVRKDIDGDAEEGQ